MNLLLLKLVLTPLLICAASLAGRRWGSVIGGLVVGLPLTSGPVVFYLALDHGSAFAAGAALGIIAGTASVAVYCLAYSWLIFHLGEPLAILAALAIFFLATAVLQSVPLALVPTYVGVIALLLIVRRLLPSQGTVHRLAAPPWWDIPARMAIATAVVLLLTSIAPMLGPRLSGLLAPVPVFLSTLGAFTHQFEGAPAAIGLLRGALAGLFSFATCFLVIALLLTSAGLAIAFLSASAVTLAMQGTALWLLHRSAASPRLQMG